MTLPCPSFLDEDRTLSCRSNQSIIEKLVSSYYRRYWLSVPTILIVEVLRSLFDCQSYRSLCGSGNHSYLHHSCSDGYKNLLISSENQISGLKFTVQESWLLNHVVGPVVLLLDYDYNSSIIRSLCISARPYNQLSPHIRHSDMRAKILCYRDRCN